MFWHAEEGPNKCMIKRLIERLIKKRGDFYQSFEKYL